MQDQQSQKTVASVLGGGGGGGGNAEKFRDHLGEVITVKSYTTVNTSNGESTLLICDDGNGGDLKIWASAVSAKQAKELAEEGLLPAAVKFTKTVSQSGREYYQLADPNSN